MGSWQVGSIIDGTYLVKKEIGSGGMGKVSLVSDLDSGIDLVVKSPYKNNLVDSLYEINNWIELPKHAYIATCFYHKNFNDKIPRLFIEHVDGGNLQEWLDDEENKIDFKSKISIAIQIANGLSYAHNNGLLHLDLRPGNILVYKKLSDGIPRIAITDFGSSRKFTDTLAPRKVIIHSSEYSAPELDSRNFNKRCDIFSFGVLLSHLLANALLFGNHFLNEQAYETRIKECFQNSEYFDRIQDIIKNDVMKIIKKSTAYSPAERYFKFEEIEQDLTKVYEKYEKSRYNLVTLTPSEKVTDYVNRGVSYFYLGRTDDARKCFENAIHYEVNSLYSHHNYGLLSWKEYGGTDQDYLNLLDKRFQKSRIYRDTYYKKNILMVQTHIERGDLETALRYLEVTDIKATDNLYTRARLFDIKGIIYLGLKRYSKAVKCFRNANKFFENNSSDQKYWLYKIHLAIAIYKKRGNVAHAEVIDLIDDALQIGKDEIGFWEDSKFKSLEERSRKAVIDCFKNIHVPRARRLRQQEIESINKRFRLGWLNRRIDLPENPVNPIIRHSPDQKYIAAGYNDGSIVITDGNSSEKCRIEQNNNGEKQAINSLKYSPDGRYIAAGYNDGSIVIWKWDENKEKIICITTFLGHRRGVKFLDFTHSGYILFSKDQTEDFACWDIYDLVGNKSSLKPYPPVNYLLEKPITSGDELEANEHINKEFEEMKEHYNNGMYVNVNNTYKKDRRIQKYTPARHLLSDIIADPSANAKRISDCGINPLAIFDRVTTANDKQLVYSSLSSPDGGFLILLKIAQDNTLIELRDNKDNSCLAVFPTNIHYNAYKFRNYGKGNNIELYQEYKDRYNSVLCSYKYEFIIYIKSKNGKLVVRDVRKKHNKDYDLYHHEYLYNATLSYGDTLTGSRYIICAGTKTLKVLELEWEWGFSNKKDRTEIIS